MDQAYDFQLQNHGNSNEASRATTYWIAYIELRRCHMCVPTFFLPSFSGFCYNAGLSEQKGVEGAIALPIPTPPVQVW